MVFQRGARFGFCEVKVTKDSSENESKRCEKDATAKSIFEGINFIKVIVLVSDIRQI